MPQIADESNQLAQVERDLIRKYGDRIPAELIGAYLREAADAFAGARIRSFVPVLLHKQLDARLRAT